MDSATQGLSGRVAVVTGAGQGLGRAIAAARWEQVQRSVPLRRLGDPYHDIGRAIVALFGDDTRYLTGATLMLDGGQIIMR